MAGLIRYNGIYRCVRKLTNRSFKELSHGWRTRLVLQSLSNFSTSTLPPESKQPMSLETSGVDGVREDFDLAVRTNDIVLMTNLLRQQGLANRIIRREQVQQVMHFLSLPDWEKIPAFDWIISLCRMGLESDSGPIRFLWKLHYSVHRLTVDPNQSLSFLKALAFCRHRHGGPDNVFDKAVLLHVEAAVELSSSKNELLDVVKSVGGMKVSWSNLTSKCQSVLLRKVEDCSPTVYLYLDIALLEALAAAQLKLVRQDPAHNFVFTRTATLIEVLSKLSAASGGKESKLPFLLRIMGQMEVLSQCSPEYRTRVEDALDSVARSDVADESFWSALEILYPKRDHKWTSLRPVGVRAVHTAGQSRRVGRKASVGEEGKQAAPTVTKKEQKQMTMKKKNGSVTTVPVVADINRSSKVVVVTKTVAQEETVETFRGDEVVARVSRPKTVTRTVTEIVEDVKCE